MRLSLAARVLLIAGTLVLTLWIALISTYYWLNDLSRAAETPAPSQLAAIADVVAAAPVAGRESVLRAVSTPLLDVRVMGLKDVPGPALDVKERAEFAAYGAALGPRLLRVEFKAGADRAHFPRLFARRTAPRVFWVDLGRGEVLVAQAYSPLIVTFFGLPAGVGAGLLGALAACAALLLLHREIRPLARLAAQVERIDPTGEVVELPRMRASTPEVAMLARAFERLQARIHAMTRSRLALIGGIQHDVRSFATRLRLRIEQLPDPEERRQAEADIADMIELLDNALLTARAGVGTLDEEMLDLGQLLEAEVLDMSRAGRPVTLALDVDAPPVWVLADRLALRRVVGNVIDNAIKYGQSAQVSLGADETSARVEVSDRGPGFPPHLQALLLEPFVRSEPSRARKTGGAGLGLSVARSLVEAHGGTIALGAAPDGGGRVTITVPLFRPA